MWKQELVVKPWTGECGSGSWCDSELRAGMHDCRWFQRRFQATFSSTALPFLLPSRLRPPTLPHRGHSRPNTAGKGGGLFLQKSAAELRFCQRRTAAASPPTFTMDLMLDLLSRRTSSTSRVPSAGQKRPVWWSPYDYRDNGRVRLRNPS